MRHEMTSASGGTLWPPVMIHSTGARILLTPAYGAPTETGAVRYILPEVRSISGDGYEEGLDRFFDVVAATCAKALDGHALSDLLKNINRERCDPEAAVWRRLEAQLGFDPDKAPDEVIEGLAALESEVGEDGLSEAASAAPGPRSAETLQKVLAASRESQIIVDLSRHARRDPPRA